MSSGSFLPNIFLDDSYFIFFVKMWTNLILEKNFLEDNWSLRASCVNFNQQQFFSEKSKILYFLRGKSLISKRISDFETEGNNVNWSLEGVFNRFFAKRFSQSFTFNILLEIWKILSWSLIFLNKKAVGFIYNFRMLRIAKSFFVLNVCLI